MDFREITVEDKLDVEEAYRRADVCDCDLAFANLIAWGESNPAQICRVQGFIVVRILLDDEIYPMYTFPLGTGDSTSVVKLIEEDAVANGWPFRLMVPSEAYMQDLRDKYPGIGFYFQRSHSDYIYNREDLASLKGGKYQAKRNHVNKFKASYNFTYGVLAAGDKDECLELLQKWRVRRLSEGPVPDSFKKELDREESCIRRAFDNFDKLSILGGTLRVDGALVAFCYGTALSDSMFCVHIEKADESYEGVFAAINQQFAEHLPANFIYVNREDDLGIQGLRRAKETYHPVEMLNKYVSYELMPVMQKVRTLWLNCFVHDTALDVEQFLQTRFKEEGMLSRYVDGELVSMLHIIPFGQAAYIYAVATDPRFRHRGIAASLISEALDKCRSMGFKEAVLIPENESAFEWYAGMGFRGRYPVTFNTRDEFDFFDTCDDYDFGKCDGTTDYAMICPLSSDAPAHKDGENVTLSDVFTNFV